MFVQCQRLLATSLSRFSPSLTVRCISSCSPLLARNTGNNRGEKLLPPEERLGYLKAAEKRVAVFAGLSLIVGYFALKSAFSKMSSRKEEQDKKKAELAKASLPRPLVVAGPSGSGKSTLLTRLFSDNPDKFGFSVSHTTRKPRPGEENGKHYHFSTRESMQKGIDAGAFIEWAEYSGNMYGTSKKAVRDVQEQGRVCVLDIEMQGVRNLKKTDLNPVYVLIRPPSIEALEERLRARQTETEESLEKRLTIAREELDYAEGPGVFDYVVMNDKLETAYETFIGVIKKVVNLDEDEGSTPQ